MKRLITLAALATSLLASGAAYAGEQTVQLAVSGMYCGTCPLTVKKSLSAVPGVSKVAVSYEQKSATVTFDDKKTNVQALIKATTDAGYASKLPEAQAPKTQ
jgi:periplasmic mercuric ion binding protein